MLTALRTCVTNILNYILGLFFPNFAQPPIQQPLITDAELPAAPDEEAPPPLPAPAQPAAPVPAPLPSAQDPEVPQLVGAAGTPASPTGFIVADPIPDPLHPLPGQAPATSSWSSCAVM